jgi:hypothetical protein
MRIALSEDPEAAWVHCLVSHCRLCIATLQSYPCGPNSLYPLACPNLPNYIEPHKNYLAEVQRILAFAEFVNWFGKRGAAIETPFRQRLRTAKWPVAINSISAKPPQDGPALPRSHAEDALNQACVAAPNRLPTNDFGRQ